MSGWIQGIPIMLKGLSVSMWIAAVASVGAVTLGGILAGLRVLAPGWVANVSRALVTGVRNTPLLVQVFIGFYVLPEVGIVLPATLVGIVVLAVHFASYCSEAIFASIRGVAKGQWEGGMAVNFRNWEILLLIVLPQALRSAMAPLFNYVLSLFKDTAILAVITVPELLQSTRSVASATFAYLPLFTVMGLMYLMVSYPGSVLARRIERRFA